MTDGLSMPVPLEVTSEVEFAETTSGFDTVFS